MPRASREIRKGRAIRRLRWLALAATLTAVAAVVAFFLAGRSGRGPAPDPEESLDTSTDLDATGEMVTVGQGFERTLTEEDRPVFTIRGERFAVDREDTVHLEGVSVTLHPEEDMRYEIEGAEGTFDVDRRSGVLTGGVELSGPDGLRLTTDRLEVTNRGGLVTSGGDVYLRLGDVFHARADRLRVALRARRLFLLGRARVASLPEAATHFLLTGDRVLLDRTRQMLEAEGRPAELERREDVLAAERLSVFLAEDEETVRYVRGEGRVVADLRSADASGGAGDEAAGGPEAAQAAGAGRGTGPEPAAGRPGEAPGGPGPVPGEEVSRLRLRGAELEVEMTPDGEEPRSFFLVGGPPDGQAVARSLGPAGEPVHTLVAPRIEGRFQEGVPVALEAGEGVELTTRESVPGAGAPPPEAGETEGGGVDGPSEPPVVRTARGRRARAGFGPDGTLESVELEGAVALTGGGVKATGERGVFRLEADEGELFGSPAVVESDRGTMEAPRVLYTRQDGLVQGRGGVRARLDRDEGRAGASVLEGSPLARGEGPLWVEAERGFFRDEPRAFLFVGSVRAWRGDDLLVANRLLGEEPEGRLVATGDVRTAWRPEEEPPSEDGGEAPAEGEEDGPAADGPLEATADELVYERDQRLLVYTGGVVAEQAERVLRCRELEVQLAPAGGVAELVCTGDARLEDPATGRILEGHRLVYDPEARLFQASAAEGGAVTLEDATGNVIEGPRMIYDIDADEVRVLGRQEPSAAESAGAGAGAAEEGSPPEAEGPGGSGVG